MPNNAIFGHFNLLSLVQISQKRISHSKISLITTARNLTLPNMQKWPKMDIFGLKNVFLSFFATFFSTDFLKILEVLSFYEIWQRESG